MTIVMLVVTVLAHPALAIINPNFTPRDLVRASEFVHLMEVRAPEDGVVTGEVSEALRGEVPDEKEFRFDLDGSIHEDDVLEALDGRKSAPAVVVLSGGGGQDAGLILIGVDWFALQGKGNRLVLKKDDQHTFAVWGGSARMLAEAVRYIENNPRADFPARSQMRWRADRELGPLGSQANDAMAVDFDDPIGNGVLALADSGDRFYRGSEVDEVEDATAELELASTSKKAVPIDLTGDGQLDLVTWDGETLYLAEVSEKGFGEPRRILDVEACLSLDAVSAGEGQAGLVVGTPDQPLLVSAEGDGYDAQPLAVGAGEDLSTALGPGGFSITADFTGDGRADVLQLHSDGALFYEGEEEGRFREPTTIEADLPRNPSAAVPGDFSQDGTLELMVGGEDGLAYLSRAEGGEWADMKHWTYELSHHGDQRSPHVIGMAAADVNADGRQGLAVFYADRKPMMFFNRGFACFGWARELDVEAATHAMGEVSMPDSGEELAGLRALRHGQSAATVSDLTGNGVPDVLGVAAETHEVWALLGARDDGPSVQTLTVALPEGVHTPVTVSVRFGAQPAGMYVVRPGKPAVLGRSRRGPATLEWFTSEGEKQAEQVIVIDQHRVELTP